MSEENKLILESLEVVLSSLAELAETNMKYFLSSICKDQAGKISMYLEEEGNEL